MMHQRLCRAGSTALIAFTLVLTGGCRARTGTALSATANAPAPVLATDVIKQIVGRDGSMADGQFKITVPQNDLVVMVDGFEIVPPMGLGSWVTFAPMLGGAMIMGDIVLRDTEILPVQQVAVEHGLSVTGLHNHFVREQPRVMFMHLSGMGSTERLAAGVKAVFDKVVALRGHDPAKSAGRSVTNTLNIEEIARILGHSGDLSRGVYKITIGRPDVALQAHGSPVSSFMGFNTWAAWQGTPEHAAVAGDIAMRESEVAAVISALVRSGIEVVAVHNHMGQEEPRIVFLHYWGVGEVRQLARGLKLALDQTAK